MRNHSIVFVMILLLGLVTVSCSNDEIVEGRVAHKVVTGVKDGTSYTIIQNTPQEEGYPVIQAKDPVYSGYLPSTGSAVIDQELGDKINRDYSNTTYLVNIDDDLDKAGTTSYIVDRELFNQIDVGSYIKFKSDKHGDFREITEILN